MGVCGSKFIIDDKILRKALEDKKHKGTIDIFLDHKKVLGNTVPLTPKCQHYCRNNLDRGDTTDFFNAPVFSPFSPLIAKKIDLSSTFLSPHSVILSPMAWFPSVEELYSDASTVNSSQDGASISPSSLHSVEPDVLSACKKPHYEAKNFLLSGDKLLPGEFLTSPKGNFYLILNEIGNLILYTSCDWEDSNILWSSNTALILEERLKSINPPSIIPPTFWLEMLPDGDVALLLSYKLLLPHHSSSVNSTISDKEQRVGEEILVLWRTQSTAPNLSSSLSSPQLPSSSSSPVPSTKSAN